MKERKIGLVPSIFWQDGEGACEIYSGNYIVSEKNKNFVER